MDEPSRMVTPAFVFGHPLHLLAFGGGVGLMPLAPGTAGTLIAVPVYWILQVLPTPVYVGVTITLFVIGIGICSVTGRHIGEHDHPGIVWDEIVGYLVTMVAAPSGWSWIVAGFVLFRIFDIWKPWPIEQLDDRVQGGFGVMLDDAVAGSYAAVVLCVAAYLLAT